MPNPWTGVGNPYTREEVVARLKATVDSGKAVIAAGAGTGISAKFIEKGGADLIIIYNSGRFRMMGHGSTAGMMAYGDANAIAMEIGEYEVLPVVEEVPVICGVHATDPRRRMWHWLLKVKDMGFSGINNFPTHTIVDGHFRGVLEETGMSVEKEFEAVALGRRMDLFSIVYVGSPDEARRMAESGADAIIAHVGTTVGGSIGVTNAVVSWPDTIKRTQEIIDAAKEASTSDANLPITEVKIEMRVDEGEITETIKEGRQITYKMGGGSSQTVSISGSRTAVSIDGQGDDRANLTVGMMCKVSMPPNAEGDIEATEVVCTK